MHAAVCLLHAGQLNRAGDVAKSGEFLGEFSWEELFPMDVRGLFNTIDEAVVYSTRSTKQLFNDTLIDVCLVAKILKCHTMLSHGRQYLGSFWGFL